ncbi:plasmid mobilization protein [Paenibacillus graminis]|uniref:plasmid mobilization protein n=1 Tax=Paenibacillus graminis TaxID=189425 RepID=UPI002DB5E826|nr:hypothetical protein [Paenibacillus graminis]MEC0167916.1 hypothetical protein [Paenibacillus graminis]
MGSANRRRGKLVPIRLDESEYADLQEKANCVGVSIPAYLRGIALRERPPIISKKCWEDVNYRLFDIVDDVEETLYWASIGYFEGFEGSHDVLLKIHNTLEEIAGMMKDIREEAGVRRKL